MINSFSFATKAILALVSTLLSVALFILIVGHDFIILAYNGTCEDITINRIYIDNNTIIESADFRSDALLTLGYWPMVLQRKKSILTMEYRLKDTDKTKTASCEIAKPFIGRCEIEVYMTDKGILKCGACWRD